jgi:hypothetical protein
MPDEVPQMNLLIERARKRPRRTTIYVSCDIDRRLEKAVAPRRQMPSIARGDSGAYQGV